MKSNSQSNQMPLLTNFNKSQTNDSTLVTTVTQICSTLIQKQIQNLEARIQVMQVKFQAVNGEIRQLTKSMELLAERLESKVEAVEANIKQLTKSMDLLTQRLESLVEANMNKRRIPPQINSEQYAQYMPDSESTNKNEVKKRSIRVYDDSEKKERKSKQGRSSDSPKSSKPEHGKEKKKAIKKTKKKNKQDSKKRK